MKVADLPAEEPRERVRFAELQFISEKEVVVVISIKCFGSASI